MLVVRLRVLTLGLAAAILFQVESALAQGGPPGKMEYSIRWVRPQQANAAINYLAEKGWRLRSASMVQCPPQKVESEPVSCVMVIMEKNTAK